jgi:aldose 1-epimerase
LQVYGGYHLKTAYPGMHGICLEPENFPDAPNHPNFPDSILRPGAVHRSFMSFTFKG